MPLLLVEQVTNSPVDLSTPLIGSLVEELQRQKLKNVQDFTQQPPAQELIARDLHGNDWKFKHIFSEQVAVSTNREVDTYIPNPSLPPQLICQLHNLTMHADTETDEVYAQMTLQPLNPEEQKEAYLPAELGTANKQPTNYFCKILTASDTSTHGGFSVPRRAAEKVFPPLDFTQQPPAQELIARDLLILSLFLTKMLPSWVTGLKNLVPVSLT